MPENPSDQEEKIILAEFLTVLRKWKSHVANFTEAYILIPLFIEIVKFSCGL